MYVALKSVKLSILGLVIFSPLVITTMLHLTKRVYVDLHKTQLSNTESRINVYKDVEDDCVGSSESHCVATTYQDLS